MINREKGFTLIELIVAFSIVSILSVVGIASFVNYSRAQAVDAEAEHVIAGLNLAKAKAQSQVKPEGCDTSTDPSRHHTLKGYSFFVDNSNETFRVQALCVPPGGSVAQTFDITLEGASQIYHQVPSPIDITASTSNIDFNVISGDVSTSATITLTGDWTGQTIVKTITVQSNGTIQKN